MFSRIALPLGVALGAAAALLFPSTARADDDATPNVATPAVNGETPRPNDDEKPAHSVGLFANPLGLALGYYGGEVDVPVSRHVAIGGEVQYYALGDTTAFGAGAGVLVFPTKETFEGLYLYPRVSYANATSKAGDIVVTADVYGIGATAGYQWTWDSGFSVRLGGGVVYYAASAHASADGVEAKVALDGAKPVLDGNVGWVF